MPAYKVVVPMTATELERKLTRMIWENARGKAVTAAKNELTRLYQDDFSRLVSHMLDSFNPGEISVTEL